MLAKPATAALLFLLTAGGAASQPAMQFPDASETVPELIELWEDSNSVCRGASGGDVKVAAACLSRSVFGAALNERGWCLGRQDEANADMSWHECEADSLRFPPFDIPAP